MRAIRTALTALIVAVIVTAILAACGALLQAAPVVRLTQTAQRQVCHGGVCSLVNTTSSWSGTCVGRDQTGRLLIVSCGHGMELGAPVSVEIESGKPERGSVLRLSREPDLSLITLDHGQPVEFYPIADLVPREGTPIQLIGYPAGQFRSRGAVIDRYGRSDVQFNLPCAPGESGGGAIAGGRLVAVITATLDTRHPLARFYKNHSCGVRLNDIQGFVVGALGYQPIIAAPPAEKPSAEKPAAVPRPQLLPGPHPAPLPAAASAEDVRGIVAGELSRLGPEIRAELVKQLQIHGTDLKEAVGAQLEAGTLDPGALAPILASAAQGAARDATKNVVEQLAPSLLAAVASHLGMGALAGSVGGPIGALAGGAIGLLGFFLHRAGRKNTASIVSAVTAIAGRPVWALRQPSADGTPQWTLPQPAQPVAPPATPPSTSGGASLQMPRDTVVTVPVADPWGLAMQQAQASILQQQPGVSLAAALPQIEQVAQTILDLQKRVIQQPASSVRL